LQFVLLVYETDAAFSARTRDAQDEFWGAWRNYVQAMVDAGVYVGGSPLQPPASASTVRLQDGRRQVQDGPLADTREQLGGFILLEVPELNDALAWAARCPAAEYGAMEVRPVDPRVDARMGVPGIFPVS
jgi:hypothetical protein